ncbi:MAG: hypothetical protein AVDCRST_MAG04-1887 [uncultured Acetobacteraceae bacterium]|uniref:Uncharacterized protein n=1 Tax=uncultured Acetobacteraceae bacterium TaxID=169975 RepID=A0A6J4ICK5_9PROT|nr:MAG: hypothetical protein AVDCRST_MAG04-1887 [uncultured Acetobacteraceae bacterium]
MAPTPHRTCFIAAEATGVTGRSLLPRAAPFPLGPSLSATASTDAPFAPLAAARTLGTSPCRDAVERSSADGGSA